MCSICFIPSQFSFIYLFYYFYHFTVEELLCLATWKDGSTKYMIGKLEHTPTSSDEEKYRCFVVGKSMGGTFDMAQSGDATCNGMSSPTDGSRTMKFIRGKLRVIIYTMYIVHTYSLFLSLSNPHYYASDEIYFS